MGYKLAGYDHLGGIEIDKGVADLYRRNLRPKHLFIMDLRQFNEEKEIPNDIKDLDILDGSPPCSTFSMAGKREKVWGKRKRFREGQSLQTLDDLVFVFLNTIYKLRPKVCLLENVEGILKGNATWYAKQIVSGLAMNGYRVQVFNLNAATMGVPQKRQRVFFIGLREDIKLPRLKLEFNDPPINYSMIRVKGGCR